MTNPIIIALIQAMIVWVGQSLNNRLLAGIFLLRVALPLIDKARLKSVSAILTD
jgi:hypothetical protein